MAALLGIVANVIRRRPDDLSGLERLFEDARTARDRGAWRKAEMLFRRAFAMAERLGADREMADALFILSGLRLMEKDVSASRRMASEAADLYSGLGEAALTLRAMKLAATAAALSR